MDRRAFVGTLGSAGLAARVRLPPAPRHWAWVHGGGSRTPVEWRAAFDRLKAAGLAGVHVGGGDTAILSAAARGAGLVFSRWTFTLNRSGDGWAKTNHPEWYTVSREGQSSLIDPPYVNYYQWLCPSRPEVRAYLADQYAQLARDPDVDEVHLDYVRHCDVILPSALWPKYGLVQDHEMGRYDYCYCEVCRAQFQAQGGRDPRSLPDPAADVAWRRYRWDSVTAAVREIAAAVHGVGKRITAAVFPTPTIARTLVRQAWDQWPLDAVFPMLYHGFYNEAIPWIGAGVREGRRALPRSTTLYAGLYLPDLPPAALAQAVRTAMGAGAAGVSLFEMEAATNAHLAAIA